MEYKVKIDAFEGPLDLLLHLIKTLEIDIYDIPVAEITDQYLDFIHEMRQLELDVASEYLVMAATLVAMKSRMLLPKPEILDAEPDDSFEDPEETREALMQQLLDYRRYKEAAEGLRVNEQARLALFSKPPSDLSRYEKTGPAIIPGEGRATVYDMVRALQQLMLRKKLKEPLHTKIAKQVLPIGQQMYQVISELKRAGHPLRFDELFLYSDKTHIVVTFLALLELMKKNFISCRQEENFADIWVSLEEGVHEIDANDDAFNY
ncbi:segregation/condensation protein A [Sporolactobacillus sp. THM7-4]|nr:segregation/condensation protein A [Sporolactobacillus sp. THM7-4]